MKEGWFGDDYLILFFGDEVAAAGERYAIDKFLPGKRIIGLRGWDDFVVRAENGATFTVPIIPIEAEHLNVFKIPGDETKLVPDARFTGKIKWYLQPIVFGGSAEAGPNLSWVDHIQHAQLVRWWNEKYRSMKRR